MSTEREAVPDDPEHRDDENPSDRELDVEGPNESAPGHEPEPEGEDPATRSTQEDRS